MLIYHIILKTFLISKLQFFSSYKKKFSLCIDQCLVLKSPTKSCALDPIPTWLLKACTDSLVPLVTRIVNESLESGTVCDILKQAVVTPLLKKPNLDSNMLKNYRPLSNLPFISKIIEKAVLTQLQEHLIGNGLLETYRSAYRKEHSTERALLAVTDNLLSNTDNRLASIVTFLDLSAAFDTRDHQILLKRLSITYGIHAKALQWFSSCLTTGSLSPLEASFQNLFHFSLESPRGLYWAPFCSPCTLNLSLTPFKNISLTTTNMQMTPSCRKLPFLPISARFLEKLKFADVKDWMNKNKLSEEKTELLVVGDRTHLCQVKKEPLTFGPNAVPFQTSAKYLGVHLDETLSMKKLVTSLCRSSYFHLRKIASIRPYLSDESTAQLVSSLILSRLDYCNSTLSGLPSCSLN